MSIGFRFTAKVEQQDIISKELRRLAHLRCSEKGNWIKVGLCRFGEINFYFEQKSDGMLSKTEMTCDCCTSIVGAGFHAAAIEFVDALVQSAHLEIDMEDETDYYNHRDFEQMRSEHFYNWLGMLLEHCVKSIDPDTSICLCWDVDQYMPADIPGSVITPFGRYSIEHLTKVLESGDVEPFAKDFFIWNEREKDARFYRNAAISTMWEECCFKPSSRSCEDDTINQVIVDCLEEAHKMDPSLPIPKADYLLLCQLRESTPVSMDDCEDYHSDYPIGYLRDTVTHTFGNTRIALHGSFTRYNGYEDRTMFFDDSESGWRNLHVSAFTTSEGDAQFLPQIFEGAAEPVTEFSAVDGKTYCAFAGSYPDEYIDTPYYQSISQTICGNQTTLITVSYQHLRDKVWAIELFSKIRANLPSQQA